MAQPVTSLSRHAPTAAPADESAQAPILELSAIEHRFGDDKAVDGVSLQVNPREVVCLLGPSGCGKTTLLRIAAGLEPVQHGSVTIDGQPMAAGHKRRAVPPEKRNVGLMFQDSALFPHLSVLENTIFGLDHLHPRHRQRRGRQLLEQLGIGELAESYPHVLSGGQQQRAALARALAPAPGLMLLDEPFAALDARLRDQIRDDTLHVLKRNDAGTLLVTHDPEEAMFMADRIAVMKDGQILQVGRPVDLYCNPAAPFVVTFFGEVNRLEGVVQRGEVDTVLGAVQVPEMADGTAVQVLIRPEAIGLTAVGEPGAHDRTHVVVSRLLGRSSLVHVCVHTPVGREVHVHSRTPGVFLPPENQPVDLRLDRSQVFVFPL